MHDDIIASLLAETDKQERTQRIKRLASTPDKILPIVLAELRQSSPARQELACEIIRTIGYPQNAQAIPDLILYLGNPNNPGWLIAVQTIAGIDPDVTVPYLIQAFLDQGRTHERWASNIKGLCFTLQLLQPEHTRRCCPAINYLLSQKDLPLTIDQDLLLDLIERVGTDHVYVLPTLFELLKTAHESTIAEHAHRLILNFPINVQASYILL